MNKIELHNIDPTRAPIVNLLCKRLGVLPYFDITLVRTACNALGIDLDGSPYFSLLRLMHVMRYDSMDGIERDLLTQCLARLFGR